MIGSEFLYQLLGGSFGFFIIEQNAGTRTYKHANSGRANAARAACNERNLTGERKIHASSLEGLV